MLVGHERAAREFRAALASGRAHHGWIVAGPRGIGKRAFVDAMAIEVLGADAAPLLAAGSHPDCRVLEAPAEGAGATQQIIAVDQVRALAPMLNSQSAMGGWRLVIIDSADQLNPNAANALLKALEEPGASVLFLLISHAPGRLLATVRSRCRMLRLERLADAEVARLLADHGLGAAEIPPLVALARGSPGLALALRRADGVALAAELDRVAAGGDALAFARSFAPAAAAPRFEAMLGLAVARLADLARAAPSPALLELVDEAARLTAEAVPLALDRVQVACALAGLLARAHAHAETR